MKTNLSKLAKSVGKELVRYSPEILTGIGITGMISSTVMAVKATPKALILMEGRKKVENVDKLTTKETVKVAWKCYIPSAVMTLASAACLISANNVSGKRSAMLATAYSMSEEAFRDYRTKVVETIGAKKEEIVKDAIAKDKVENNPVDTNEIIITGNGSSLCYESISGRYFQSDIESLRRAENRINKMIFNEMSASLNDFYYEIGLNNTDIGYSLGWNVNKGLVDLSFSSQIATNGTPCLVINYSTPPTYGYQDY